MIPGTNAVMDILQGIGQRVEDVPNKGLGNQFLRAFWGRWVLLVIRDVFVNKILKTSTVAKFHVKP